MENVNERNVGGEISAPFFPLFGVLTFNLLMRDNQLSGNMIGGGIRRLPSTYHLAYEVKKRYLIKTVDT